NDLATTAAGRWSYVSRTDSSARTTAGLENSTQRPAPDFHGDGGHCARDLGRLGVFQPLFPRRRRPGNRRDARRRLLPADTPRRSQSPREPELWIRTDFSPALSRIASRLRARGLAVADSSNTSRNCSPGDRVLRQDTEESAARDGNPDRLCRTTGIG